MLVALIVWVILFIPMKVYSLPATLPFKLEMYRLLVALIAAGWLLSLLADPRVRFRRTPVDGPIRLFVFAVLGSVIVNRSRVNTLESEVREAAVVLRKLLGGGVPLRQRHQAFQRCGLHRSRARRRRGGCCRSRHRRAQYGLQRVQSPPFGDAFLHLHASNIPTIPSEADACASMRLRSIRSRWVLRSPFWSRSRSIEQPASTSVGGGLQPACWSWERSPPARARRR